MRDGWLERDGATLHYLEWPGDAGRPILALHGLSSNARFWSRVAERAGGRRFVALDQRSHGSSVPSQPGDSIATFVDDALHAASALSLDRPVVAGHSWGAVVALELAARHPDRIAALAFIDGPAWPLAEAMPWAAFAARAQPPLPRYRDVDEAIAAARASFGPAWSDDLEEFVRAGLVADRDALVLPLTYEARGRILRDLFDLRQDLAWRALAVPAVAAFAARKSELMLEATRRAAERIASVAGGVVIKWYDTPHDIPLYAPDDIASDIRQL
jgi:lipase